MRESFGGAFMIKVVMVFIVIYISFMAVAVNYAKAFRVKNQIINILEQMQYKGKDDTVTNEAISTYLSSVAYNVGDNVPCENNAIDSVKGICIVSKGSNSGTGTYYVVTTFISVDFPFFNIHMRLPIRGETKTIVY